MAYSHEELRQMAVRAEMMLRRVYRANGPFAARGRRRLSSTIYARMTRTEVDAKYDFADRHLMHDIAKIISR